MDDDLTPRRLAGELETLSEESIACLRRIVALPVDGDNGGLLRAQVAAAVGGLNTQLRADALRLRAMRADKALDALIAILRQKESIVPSIAMESLVSSATTTQ